MRDVRAWQLGMVLVALAGVGLLRVETRAELAASGSRVAAPAEPPAPSATAAVQKLLDEASGLAQAGKQQEALVAAERALAAARRAADAPGEARAQAGRGLGLAALGRITEAVEAWRESAAVWERIGDGPGQVKALAQSGLLLAREKPEAAQLLFERAVATADAEERRPQAAAFALWQAGLAAYTRGQLEAAGLLWREALQIYEKLAPGSLDVAGSLAALGALYRVQGELVEARGYHQRALEIREKLAPGSLDLAASLTSMGIVVWQQGNLAEARIYYQRAVQIQEKLAPGFLAAAASLTGLGGIAMQEGDLAFARSSFQRALGFQEKVAPDSLEMADSLNNLGLVSFDQNDLAAARNYHQRALELRQKLAPDSLPVSDSLSNLGVVAREQGDLTTGRTYFQRAVAIREKLAPVSLSMAACLTNLGAVTSDQGDLVAARSFFQRALEMRDALAPGSLDVAASLNNLGEVTRLQGDRAAARDLFERSMEVQERLAPGSLPMASILRILAGLSWREGNRVQALRLAGRAWQIAETQAGVITGDEAQQAFRSQHANYASQLAHYQAVMGKAREAFGTLEAGRARALTQLLLERRVMPASGNAALWAQHKLAVQERDRAEQMASQAAIAETRTAHARDAARAAKAGPEELARKQTDADGAAKALEAAQSRYTETRLKTNALWDAIRQGAPRAFPAPLTVEQAARALRSGTLFLAFSVGEEQTDLFLLRAGDPASLIVRSLPIKRSRLHEEVGSFGLAVSKRNADWAGAGRRLSDVLFPPEVRAAIRGSQRLLISPDGPLWEVPFAALVMSEAKPPLGLGLQKPITYTASLAVFAQCRGDRPQLAAGGKPRALVLGDLIFARHPGQRGGPAARRPASGERAFLFFNGKEPEPLPGTKVEAATIAGLYGGEPLTGAAGTEAVVRREIGKADVVHLATHGYLLPVRPMSSGVLLTPPEQEPPVGENGDDGILQAWEIQNQLKLRAELVVLSACETGLGRNVAGEGIVGLTRALQYAGARSVVASHWKVPDESTRMLMMAFHRKLREGLAKDEALRQAMVVVRSKPETKDPYFWAAFCLSGDPDNPNLGGPIAQAGARRSGAARSKR